MPYLLHPEHLGPLILGVLAPIVLVALVAVHIGTGRRPLTLGPRLGRTERRRQRSIRAHRRDVALGPPQITATLTNLPAFDDTTDDAIPVDMAALMAEQDLEIGREFTRWVEDVVALETAVSFGYIRLEGAPR